MLFDGAPGRERRIGESLPGAAVQLLRKAGFTPSARHHALSGAISAWGDPTPVVVDHFVHPHGAGLRLDRAAFDLELRAWAAEAGVKIRPAYVGAIDCRADEIGLIAIDGENVRAAFLVDASGQSSFGARKLGALRQPEASLFAVHGEIAASPSSCACTIVASTTNGWWYAVGLPGGALLASFHCDVDHARWLLRHPSHWLATLKAVPLVHEHFPIAIEQPPPLTIASAASAGVSLSCGDRWLAVGDAARSFDPVTSYGLLSAVHDGIAGAAAVVAATSGQKDVLETFVRRRARRYLHVERQCRDLYRNESRWPEAPFWARRQHREVKNYGDDIRGNRRHA